MKIVFTTSCPSRSKSAYRPVKPAASTISELDQNNHRRECGSESHHESPRIGILARHSQPMYESFRHRLRRRAVPHRSVACGSQAQAPISALTSLGVGCANAPSKTSTSKLLNPAQTAERQTAAKNRHNLPFKAIQIQTHRSLFNPAAPGSGGNRSTHFLCAKGCGSQGE